MNALTTNKELIEQCNRSIVSDVKISYQPKVKPKDRPLIRNSFDIYQILLHGWDMDNIYLFETAKLVLMNRAQRVLGVMTISTGGITGTVIDVRLVMIAALQSAASNIALAHSHPSGNLTPSKADELITQKIKEGAAILDIKLLDHIIISPDGYYSFADEGRC